jgi:hypothetical protein
MTGSHNNINVLKRSPVFGKLVEGHVPLRNYKINIGVTPTGSDGHTPDENWQLHEVEDILSLYSTTSTQV